MLASAFGKNLRTIRHGGGGELCCLRKHQDRVVSFQFGRIAGRGVMVSVRFAISDPVEFAGAKPRDAQAHCQGSGHKGL